jgi:hypothetical protein
MAKTKTKTKKKTKKTSAPSAAAPSAKGLAAVLGVTLKTPMKTAQIQSLRKATPGYVNVLDDAAAQLADDAGLLGLKDVTADALLATKKEQRALAAKEAVAEAVHRAIYEQRLVVDDRGMKMLDKIARRVNAMTEDDPDLPTRWKFLLDYVGEFRPGRGPAKAATAPAKA